MRENKVVELQPCPFHRASKPLADNGYSILPDEFRDNKTFVKEWTRYCRVKPDNDTLRGWWKSGDKNISVCLGPSSGIVAVDFDYDVDGLHERIKTIMGRYTVAKKGSKGFTAFFRYNKEISKSWAKDGEVVVELLSDNKKTTLPPSIHPKGMAYEYITELTLENTSADQLPYLPTDFTEKLDRLFNKNSVPVADAFDVAQVKVALGYISADDYHTWIKVGMALKTTFGDEGYAVWEEWSSESGKFDSNQALTKWDSFDAIDVTAATIYYLAKEEGFVPQSSFDNSSKPTVFSWDTVQDNLDTWRTKGRPTGLKVGIDGFDRFLHLRRKELTVITGAPNSGKSEWLDFMVYKCVSNHNLKACYFSPEKDVIYHAESFIHRFSGKSFEDRTAAEDTHYKNLLKDKINFIDHQSSNKDIDSVLAQIKRVKDEFGLDIAVIDPYSRIYSKYTGDEFSHAKYVLERIQGFAQQNNVKCFLVAHPKTLETKNGKIPRISLYSISGGAAFYNNTDNGIIVYRDGSEIEVDIAKVRYQDIDQTGQFKMQFDKPTRTFSEIPMELDL